MVTNIGNPRMISLRNVVKTYGNIQILKGISLDINQGEVVFLVGPSGSGKSTLLKCINNLESLTSGEIYIDGRRAFFDESSAGLKAHSHKKVAAVRSKLGMVFQDFNLFPHKTALENVMEGPVHVLRIPKAEARERALMLLKRVGLDSRAGHYPGELSGGQKQRTAIARALAMQPTAMLFDEPTSALDPELVAEVLDVMRQLMQEGMTMVIVTHEMAFAQAFAHRALFMAEGEIVEQGEPARLFRDPQSTRLQAFLKRFKQGYQL